MAGKTFPSVIDDSDILTAMDEAVEELGFNGCSIENDETFVYDALVYCGDNVIRVKFLYLKYLKVLKKKVEKHKLTNTQFYRELDECIRYVEERYNNYIS